MKASVSLCAAAALALCLAACKGGKKWEDVGGRGIDLYEKGRYAEALPLALESLAIAEKRFGDDVRTVYSIDLLGMIHLRTGSLDKAKPYFERAIEMNKRILKPNDPKQGHYFNNLAELLAAQGKYDEAETLYSESLSLYRGAFGEISLAVAGLFSKMGELYTRWGVHTEAEKSLRRAAAINDRLEKPDLGVQARVSVNLGWIALERGKLEEADRHCPKGAQLRRSLLPAAHTDLARALGVSAHLHLRRGRLDRAEELLKEAVGIYEGARGADDKGLLEAWLGMAELRAARGEHKEAERLFELAIQGYENPYVLIKALKRFGVYCLARGRNEDAARVFLAALEQHVKSPKADKADLEDVLVGLGRASLAGGRRREAEGYLLRALETNEERYSYPHESTLKILVPLAQAASAGGDKAKSDLYIRRMMKYADMFGRGHRIRKSTLRRMAGLYRELGNRKKAEELEARALEGR